MLKFFKHSYIAQLIVIVLLFVALWIPVFISHVSEVAVGTPATPLYNLIGSLRVDKPDNHNGLTKNKEYPIFDVDCQPVSDAKQQHRRLCLYPLHELCADTRRVLSVYAC